MLPARGSLAATGVLLVMAAAACVEVPQEVRQTFAPAGPSETSYYRRRPDAPPPDGFVRPEASAPPTATPTPTASTGGPS
jgi:hypothetical protein